MDKPAFPTCARCTAPKTRRRCMAEKGRGPDNCPTSMHADALTAALERYDDPDIQNFARQASIQEGEGYGDRDRGYARVRPVKPRILETIELARRMNFSRLGLVFCIGLAQEARRVDTLLAAAGFEVVSVACKVGCVPKEHIGVADNEKIQIGRFEAMCNPVAQAELLNRAETQFNILMGLCVGHDSLVLKYSKALCTVLAAKDRLLGHNPLAAVYNLDSYYRYLK